MKHVRFDSLSTTARTVSAVLAAIACTAVMSGVLGLFMTASGESFASLAGLKPAASASAVVARETRPARRG